MNKKERFVLSSLLRWNRRKTIRDNCFTLKLTSPSKNKDINEVTATTSSESNIYLSDNTLNIIPINSRIIKSSKDFRQLILSIYRKKGNKSNEYITSGFDVIKQINNLNKSLTYNYNKHLANSDGEVNKKAVLKIGICECVTIAHTYCILPLI